MPLNQLLDLPTGVLVLLGVVIVIELALLIVGVVAWARTPDAQMPRPNKWVWLVLILFVQILGPITFLLVRRSEAKYASAAVQPEALPGARHAASRTAADTADLLYGRREDKDPR
ncbi:PLDc_N domain-containing protein [Tessaracoccus sp. MC1627]|uniref:PLD nuclease N-terminal domain-containing protein n=1 Tax=Tessaracoccus sp. MC1627 TaxID=2760312 RepID=UPI0016024466|nr:PLD nuclease N-terminal domain-containing protein [Tessaracoccus sp. MC1627]MBB1512597.1 PLDc_N domain-containing protein [Tessaracoccus sp. MC1627]